MSCAGSLSCFNGDCPGTPPSVQTAKASVGQKSGLRFFVHVDCALPRQRIHTSSYKDQLQLIGTCYWSAAVAARLVLGLSHIDFDQRRNKCAERVELRA